MVASVVYLLIAGQNVTTLNAHELNSKKNANSNQPNAINFLNNYNSINRYNRANETNRRNETQIPQLKVLSTNNVNNHNTRGDNFNLRTSPTSSPPTVTTTSSASSNIFASSTTAKSTISAKTPQQKTILLSATKSTYENNLKETSTVKNVKVYTNSNSRRKLPQPAPKHTTLLLPTADDLEENVVERSKLLFPSKETLENFGFTSGHQNSFGVPIEEDERVLRILNYEMINSQPREQKQKQNADFTLLSITTDANILHTKVSPTLPNIKKNFAPTERIRAINITTDDGKTYHPFYNVILYSFLFITR